MRETELLLYTNMEHDTILKDMVWLMEEYQQKNIKEEELKKVLFSAVNQVA